MIYNERMCSSSSSTVYSPIQLCVCVLFATEMKMKAASLMCFSFLSSTSFFILLLLLCRLVPYIVIDDDRGVSTPEKFYKVGSTIELKCIIDKIPSRSNYVLWKHGERMLNYDTSRGGIR